MGVLLVHYTVRRTVLHTSAVAQCSAALATACDIVLEACDDAVVGACDVRLLEVWIATLEAA